jgi:GTPase SAR1 family protein
MNDVSPLVNPPQDEGPEWFDPALLIQPAEVRLAWFEKECLIDHARLDQVCSDILQMICSPGDGVGFNRLGTTVLVIGPARVGKTTLIEELKRRLLERAKERMRCDPSHLPFVSVSAPESGRGRFDWTDYYIAVLRAVNYPFLKSGKVGVRVRDLRDAMEEALIQHQPYGIFIDEAHHLAKAASGRGVQDQLDHLKDLENRTGVCHVLVGTYEMRRFRTVTAQLAGRGIDIHFARYDATVKEDREEFRSALWALQRQLPVEEEPLLTEHLWEMLYARSIGCIGLLKLHLNRALSLALSEKARTVTEAHLKATTVSEDRLKEMLDTALKGEQDLTEPEGGDERLLRLLGLRGPEKKKQTEVSKDKETVPSPQGGTLKPGNRAPTRDPIGSGSDGELPEYEEEKGQVAG